MKLAHLTTLACLVAACDTTSAANSASGLPDATSDSDAVDADAGTDRLHDRDVPAPRRTAAQCSEIGTGESMSFELTSDYFDVCGDDAEDADRAFTWTAPAAGFYRATAGNEQGTVLLELREGLCSESSGSVLRCGTVGVLENGGVSRVAFHAEQGDQFTMIVDAAEDRVSSSGVPGEPFPLNEFSLEVNAVSCPGIELESSLPATTEFILREATPTLREVTCGAVPSQNQRSAAFVAPRADRYRFTVSEGPESSRFALQLSLALFADSCLGQELTCADSDGDAGRIEVVRELEQWERVIVLVDSAFGSGVSDPLSAILTVDFADPSTVDAGN